jgi:hypothetical protein
MQGFEGGGQARGKFGAGDNQEVDVASGRRETACGERAIEVKVHKGVAQGLLHRSEKIQENGIYRREVGGTPGSLSHRHSGRLTASLAFD